MQLPVELHKTDIAGIANLTGLSDMSCDKYETDDETNYLSDLRGAEANRPVSLKQSEFSLTQFSKSMGQANYSVFREWKKVWVVGITEKQHTSMTQG